MRAAAIHHLLSASRCGKEWSFAFGGNLGYRARSGFAERLRASHGHDGQCSSTMRPRMRSSCPTNGCAASDSWTVSYNSLECCPRRVGPVLAQDFRHRDAHPTVLLSREDPDPLRGLCSTSQHHELREKSMIINNPPDLEPIRSEL